MSYASRFANDPRSVAAARSFVVNVLRDCPRAIRERAVLMVSELATNAVKHARSEFTVVIDEATDGFRIEVQDTGEGEPIVRAAAPTDPSGRGLRIVEAMSDQWGVERRPAGKVVWFELAIPPG